MVDIQQFLSTLGKTWRALVGGGDAVRDAIETVFADNFDGLVVIGADGSILASSRTAVELLVGDEVRTLRGRQMDEILPLSMIRTVEQVFASGKPAEPTPMELATLSAHEHRKAMTVQYVATLSDLGGWRGNVSRRVVCVTFWDVTERRRREEELAFMGTHDPLTGALTRTALIKIIEALLGVDRSRAAGLTLFLLDLGRFKSVNDTLGHSYGDQVLKQAVGRLKAAGVETVARLGGDVFALVRHGRMSAAETEIFCENLIERIVLPYSLSGHRALLGASIGFTHSDLSGYDPDVLLAHAGMALSAAKASTGNAHVRFAPEMDDRLKERQNLDAALRVALERGQMSLSYEPQVVFETGEAIGVEATLRWTHPTLGVMPAERFMTAAEETGHIVELGRWALQTACRDALQWPDPTRLSVVVSPVQFELTDVLEDVKEALELSGLHPHRLEIAVTEAGFANKSAPVIEALHKLRDLGVGVVLNDYGSGYSSLSYLGRLPIDKIKIDRTFVERLPGDAEAGAVIRAVMTLSETLNKVVIAEGVDTEDQAWMLRMMGCKVGQGPHFSLPRPASEIGAWLSERSERRRHAV